MRKDDVVVGMDVSWYGYSPSHGESHGDIQSRHAIVLQKMFRRCKIMLDNGWEIDVNYSTLRKL